MKINENYNSASQKYGINIVKELTSLGLPPQFLLSVCRFHTEVNVPLRTLVFQFKEWLKYVLKYNRQYDVNKLSYDDFTRIISIEKGKHCVPNVVYKDDLATLGRLDNANDVKYIPVKNQWCIKSQRKFDNYKNQGYVFYVIYLPSEPLPFTYVIAAIFRGNVQYYNTEDYEQWEDLRKDGDIENSDHEIYQRKLPRGLVTYLYNIAANQTEQIENNQDINENNMKSNKKQVIRFTESNLHRVISESVKRVLKEYAIQAQGEGGQNISVHGNNPGDWLTMQKLRQKQIALKGNKAKRRYAMNRNEENFENMTDDLSDAQFKAAAKSGREKFNTLTGQA